MLSAIPAHHLFIIIIVFSQYERGTFPDIPTMIPPNAGDADRMGVWPGLSPIDIERVQVLYGCVSPVGNLITAVKQ